MEKRILELSINPAQVRLSILCGAAQWMRRCEESEAVRLSTKRLGIRVRLFITGQLAYSHRCVACGQERCADMVDDGELW